MNRTEEIANAIYLLAEVIEDIVRYESAIDPENAIKRLNQIKIKCFNPAEEKGNRS